MYRVLKLMTQNYSTYIQIRRLGLRQGECWLFIIDSEKAEQLISPTTFSKVNK